MYPWLVELLERWRREGRRPPASIGREAGILLRSSHVRETTQDEELVRSSGANDLLLRVPRNLPDDGLLLRMPDRKPRE